MSESSTLHGFQYASAAHQSETAIAGMWAFLATEALFFGPLFLAFGFSRYFNQAGFDAGAAQTNLAVGTINTVLLLTSSLAYAIGDTHARGSGTREGDGRMAQWLLSIAWLLGLSFLLLKFAVEWREDIRNGFVPGAGFSITGPSRGGAELFFTFYFVSTAIHGLHLLVGLLLLGWLIWTQAPRRQEARTAVRVIGLYWSFVDLIWLLLYPLIYLVGR
jgi:cytochrome c oxidase subunit III